MLNVIFNETSYCKFCNLELRAFKLQLDHGFITDVEK